VINEIHEVKRGLIQEIELYFKEKEAEVRRETSKYTQTQKNLESLKKELEQATKELKALKKGLFEPSKTVTIIEKTNKIDYSAMMDHFRKKIKKI
jgi:5-bromo-4-chloroindolyl phosphate hydrolysis protein